MDVQWGLGFELGVKSQARTDVNSLPCAARFGSSGVRLGRSHENFDVASLDWPACLSQARPGLPPGLACCSLLLRAWRSKPTRPSQPSPVQTDRAGNSRKARENAETKKICAFGGLGRLASACGVSAGASDQPTNFVVRHHVAVFSCRGLFLVSHQPDVPYIYYSFSIIPPYRQEL